MKFKVWLNSGANIYSTREVYTSLDELGISENDWKNMSEDEQEEVMRDVAFERADWGFEEI